MLFVILMQWMMVTQPCHRNLVVSTVETPCILSIIKVYMAMNTNFRISSSAKKDSQGVFP
ncbi:hypothetical protein PMI08_04613 [Brevibacillus sp. CF112]|nr:hypothetical protein PMI08_04613 [Brevibacillus sp. CF112]